MLLMLLLRGLIRSGPTASPRITLHHLSSHRTHTRTRSVWLQGLVWPVVQNLVLLLVTLPSHCLFLRFLWTFQVGPYSSSAAAAVLLWNVCL